MKKAGGQLPPDWVHNVTKPSHFLLVGAKPANLLPGSKEEDAATGKGGQGGKPN